MSREKLRPRFFVEINRRLIEIPLAGSYLRKQEGKELFSDLDVKLNIIHQENYENQVMESRFNDVNITQLNKKKLLENKDTIKFQLPEELVDSYQFNKLAVDIFIEYHSSRFNYISGPKYWVQLPRKNHLAKFYTNYESRINLQGFITAFVSKDSPNVIIKTIGDHYTFKHLLVTDYNEKPFPMNDPRNKKKLNLYKEVEFSDKGNYLAGILELFGTLSSAHYCLSERYWREIFDYLSDRVKVSDERYQDIIKSKIEQQFKDVPDLINMSERKLEFLSRLVNTISKERIQLSKYIPFEHFEKISKKELEEFNKFHPDGEKYKLDPKNRDLLQKMHQLLEENILILGLIPRCPRCGIKNWISTTEIKHNLTCDGCQFNFSLPPEPKWHYKLNTLFALGYSQQGLLPVILVLGQLLKEARSSFLYTYCMDLYDERDNTIYYDKNIRPVGDIDIICIKDSEFIIGEVKQTVSLFKSLDFEKMYNIATRIYPDKVIFSSLDEKPNEFVQSNVKKLQERLKPHGIKCEWYQLDEECFEPTWIR